MTEYLIIFYWKLKYNKANTVTVCIHNHFSFTSLALGGWSPFIFRRGGKSSGIFWNSKTSIDFGQCQALMFRLAILQLADIFVVYNNLFDFSVSKILFSHEFLLYWVPETISSLLSGWKKKFRLGGIYICLQLSFLTFTFDPVTSRAANGRH